MKELIRKILKESNEEMINKILDKINDIGYDNLSPYEKSLLGKLSAGDNEFVSVEDDVMNFLTKTYGEFIYEDFVEKTYGGRFTEKGYIFLNDDLELMMKLVLTVNGEIRNVLYIKTDIIHSLDQFDLTDDEMNQSIIEWLNKTYPQFNFNQFKIRLLF